MLTSKHPNVLHVTDQQLLVSACGIKDDIHWCLCSAYRSIAISSNEEQLALSLAGGPAFTLALNNQELMKADDMNFELLGPGVHTAGWSLA